MCSRYKLDADPRKLRETYAVNTTPYNEEEWGVAYPSSAMPIVLNTNSERQIFTGRWGLYPPTMQDIDEIKKFNRQYATHNARTETLKTSRLYSKVWEKGQRCVIPVTKFNEWVGEKGKKQVLDIGVKGRHIFSIAGLFSGEVTKPGVRPSFTMITTTSNDQLKDVHTRMPVILEDWETWLDPDLDTVDAFEMLKPFGREIVIENG